MISSTRLIVGFAFVATTFLAACSGPLSSGNGANGAASASSSPLIPTFTFPSNSDIQTASSDANNRLKDAAAAKGQVDLNNCTTADCTASLQAGDFAAATAQQTVQTCFSSMDVIGCFEMAMAGATDAALQYKAAAAAVDIANANPSNPPADDQCSKDLAALMPALTNAMNTAQGAQGNVNAIISSEMPYEAAVQGGTCKTTQDSDLLASSPGTYASLQTGMQNFDQGLSDLQRGKTIFNGVYQAGSNMSCDARKAGIAQAQALFTSSATEFGTAASAWGTAPSGPLFASEWPGCNP